MEEEHPSRRKKVNGYDLTYDWFNGLAKKQHIITGYVIMPNHLHMLLYFGEGKQSLNKAIGNGKRFMACEIINKLEAQNEIALLDSLQRAVVCRLKAHLVDARPVGKGTGRHSINIFLGVFLY